MLTIISLVALGLSSPPASVSDSHREDSNAARTLLVRGEKVYVRPGRVIENGAVLIQDGVVINVGRELQAPEGARVVEGKVVCAGFIDAWSNFALEDNALNDDRVGAATRASDAIDPYIDVRLEEQLLSAGITAYRAQPSLGARAGGVGAVIRVHPQKLVEHSLVLGDASVAGGIGLRRDGRATDVFDRVAEVDRWIGAVSEGLSYLQDKNEYTHELAEWEKKIAEKQKELDDGFKKAKKDREKAQSDAKEKGSEFKEKEYKEDKKPKAPRFDADKEVLARVAAGEIPLVIEVHRALEIRNLLEGTAKFDRLRLVLAGASEALTCAEELKARRVPVIVWPRPVAGSAVDERDSARLSLAAALDAAGVEVLFGSGADTGLGSRDLPLLAALAIGHGMPAESALAALTTRPARVFDVGDKLGSLEVGREADVLVLSGEPFAGTTQVRFVISGGDVVVEERKP